MKKRYFPKNFSLPSRRISSPKKLGAKLQFDKHQRKGKNLKHEFDIMIRKRHTMLSSDQIDLLWKHIGTILIQAPNTSLEELIGTLDIDSLNRLH